MYKTKNKIEKHIMYNRAIYQINVQDSYDTLTNIAINDDSIDTLWWELYTLLDYKKVEMVDIAIDEMMITTIIFNECKIIIQ